MPQLYSSRGMGHPDGSTFVLAKTNLERGAVSPWNSDCGCVVRMHSGAAVQLRPIPRVDYPTGTRCRHFFWVRPSSVRNWPGSREEDENRIGDSRAQEGRGVAVQGVTSRQWFESHRSVLKFVISRDLRQPLPPR